MAEITWPHISFHLITISLLLSERHNYVSCHQFVLPLIMTEIYARKCFNAKAEPIDIEASTNAIC